MQPRLGKNSVFYNGQYHHKRCPQEKLSLEDSSVYKELKDSIVEALFLYGSPEARDRGLNWFSINGQINKLKQDGFTLDDMLYSFNRCIQRDKTFWGFGRVNKFISQDTLLHHRMEQVKEKVNDPVEVKFSHTAEEYEW